MGDAVARWTLWGFALYGLTGLLFAIAFQMRALLRITAAARGAGPAFRLLILPGMVALWPLLMRRWRESRA
jgi:hypothetical protein